MGSPNWGVLKAQGRVKEIGVPWSNDELKAVYELKIPAEFVRRGCLTTEDYESMLEGDQKHEAKTGEKPLEAMGKTELVKKAEEADLEITPQASEDGLRNMLSNLAKPKAKKKETSKEES